MSDVRQTLLSETQAREVSETLMSDSQVSAHTDTNTALLQQLNAMKQQLEATQAENVRLKAQVVEQSSSSTSVQRQLADIKDELDALKLNIIPKINSVQDSQLKTSEDIHSLTDSQLNVQDNVQDMSTDVSRMELIYRKLSYLQDELEGHIVRTEDNYQRIDKEILYLHNGLRLLYNMVKVHHPPNEEQRQFFEVQTSRDGALGGTRGSALPYIPPTVEDPSTKGERPQEKATEEVMEVMEAAEAEIEAGTSQSSDKGKQKVQDEDMFMETQETFVEEESDNEFPPGFEPNDAATEDVLVDNYDDWEEIAPPDQRFEEELKK